MVRIWFNHWFSTAYNIINMVKEQRPDFYIIGSNENLRSPLSAVCDEWWMEPVLPDDQYVDFCLSFCREHDVDVFIPRRKMVAISKRKDDFHAIGVRVMVDDYLMVSLLNQKDKAYAYLAEKGIATIPPYQVVTTAADFAAAYEMLKKSYEEICFKFVCDEGGKTYRRVVEKQSGYEGLFHKVGSALTLEAALSALSERKEFPPIMVMPNLPGDEVSVDCLHTEQGLIMLPRIKNPTRIERLSFQEEILAQAREVYAAIPLEWPCNIQFKYLHEKRYFLEVNTRMSGGIQMACKAAGVNIPGLAVEKILGREVRWTLDKTEKYLTHVEFPIVLS